MSSLSTGNIVETTYNSGRYIGEIIEDKGNFVLVKIMAVLSHPMQGDLHNRYQTEGIAFHERKALAHHEKINARKRTSKLFEREVPAYADSLQQAVESYKATLKEEDTVFNQKSLEKIADLETHYYNKIYQK